MNAMKGFLLCVALLICGLALYAQFAEIPVTMIGVSEGSAAWGDYDSDGDLDLLLTGETGLSMCATRIYRNDGNNCFTEIPTGVTNIMRGVASWGDYDNDGDLDILLTGHYENRIGSEVTRYHVAKVYQNNGNDTFTDIEAGLTGVAYCDSAWGDYDNDGDLDIVLAGLPQTGDTIFRIYRNNGDHTFSPITTSLTYLSGHMEWGDYDNDGDLDLLLSGNSITIGHFTAIYRNDGNDVFTFVDIGLSGVYAGAIAWADYDNDGDLDILLTGYDSIGYLTKVYRNDGNNIFTDINAGLLNMFGTSVVWGDYDNDGLLDILLNIHGYGDNFITKLYRNIGNDTFIEIPTNLSPLGGCRSAMGDYDTDGDLDIIMTGFSVSPLTYETKLFLNYTANASNPPFAPSNLRASVNGTNVEFHWDAAIDNQTPSSGLNYALRIGTTPGACDFMSPMSSSSGYRRIPVKGYANSNCSWKIKRSTLPDLFYWSVQAIDTAFQGSVFAPVQEVSFLPRIALLSDTSISYGSVPVEGTSDWVAVTFKNTSLAELDVDSVHFYNPASQFELNYPHAGLPLSAGATDTLYVRFSPIVVGAFSDTLYIESDAVNSPVLKIRLTGTGIHVPPQAPQYPLISMDGNNVVLTWDAVTQTIFNTPVTPDYYLVFHASDPYGEYTYLGATSSLQYTHPLAGLFSPFMFYKVKAYKYYGRGAFDISSLGLEPGMPEDEVMRRLRE